MATIDNMQDVLDIRDIIERVEELQEERDDYNADSHPQAWSQVHEDDAAELKVLEAMLEDLAGNGGDHEWEGTWYPVTLIRDSYFTDYAQEMLEDCGTIPRDLPGWVEIDWEATARNVRIDYTSTEFDGVTYWYR